MARVPTTSLIAVSGSSNCSKIGKDPAAWLRLAETCPDTTVTHEQVRVRLDTVVVTSQHAADVDLDALLVPDVREDVGEHVLAELQVPGYLPDARLLMLN
jgi:S-adenosylmethionine synthetase